MEKLLRWSTGSELGPRGADSSRGKQQPTAPAKNNGARRPPLMRQRSLGEIAHRSEVDDTLSRAETLIRIARLQEGDGVWVRRSDDVWTYAAVKAREGGASQDASLVFTVNGRGATKKFPVTHWAKYVRIVKEDDDPNDEELEREEDEIDAMMSDGELNESMGRRSRAKTGRDEHSKSDHQLSGLSRRSKAKAEEDDVHSKSDQQLYDLSHRDKGKSIKFKAGGDQRGGVQLPSESSRRDKGKKGKVKPRDDQHLRRSSQERPRESSPDKGKKSKAKDAKFDQASDQQPSPRVKGKKSKAKGGQLMKKVSEEYTLVDSLDACASDPSAESADTVPSKDSPARAATDRGTGARPDLRDLQQMSMYTFFPGSLDGDHKDDEQQVAQSDQQQSASRSRVKGKKGKAKGRPLVEGHALEESLVTFASDPTTKCTNAVPGRVSPADATNQEKEAGVDPQDLQVSMYTFSGAADDSHAQTGEAQDHEVSMYTFWGDQDDLDDGSCAPDDQQDSSSPIDQHHVVRSASYRPILKRRPTPEDEKSKQNVSFNIPETPRSEGPSSARSSMTSEHSFRADYYADAEENGASDEPGGICKVSEILRRSSSLPLPLATLGHGEGEPDEAPKRRQYVRPPEKHRVSWSEVDQIKEEISACAQKTEATKSMTNDNGPAISKKKLKELDMGETIPKQYGKVRQRSFHDALKSIHRRSAVMMPPTSSVAVNLN